MTAAQADQLSAQERIDEIAEILAAGLMRLHARKSSTFSADVGEVSLHISASKSADPLSTEVEQQE